MICGSITWQSIQGIANLARDFHRHGVVHRVLTVPHPHYAHRPDRIPGAYTRATAAQFLDGLNVLLLFETAIDWNVVREAVRRKVKVCVLTNYEYTNCPFPVPVDLFFCPSLLDIEYYKDRPHIFLPVPVDKPWRQRTAALRFVHNAGHGQWSYAKGTPELIEAMKHVQSPITLTIRGQPDDAKIVRLFRQHAGNPRIEFVMREVPEDELYDGFDVLVAPEHFNGLSLPLQEAHASGMLVITTDRYPMNTWLPRQPLIPVERYEKRTIETTFDWAIIDPRRIAETIDTWYGQDITDLSLAGKAWAEEHSWERLGPKYLAALESVLA